jgi:hypothetical protein
MKNEFLDFLKGASAFEIAGMVFAAASVVIAVYTRMKVALLVRRDRGLAIKFRIDVKPWLVEAEQSFLAHKYGPREKKDHKQF